ncbi:HMG box transcription factor BBX [Anopheles moucheti]|uniref:HMG box transcription factor BBX n=1 Tax=Anopheles moucheti TaxID=186751 RepID=UPI0022F049E6|nr:HMG box transcription factor BBX [Anopheles moucheti]
MDSNNNLADRNNCHTFTNPDDDHQHDETIIREQEHENTNVSEWNWSKTTHNIQSKTDDGCITSQLDVSQPKDEFTKVKTIETLDKACQTGELADGTTLPIPDTAEDVTEQRVKYELKRPSNSFLLFCKQHRSILSNHYNEENRLITEKLGKWWNQLTEEQKSPYEIIASQYRKQMLAVDPGFKWIKRTPTNRQPSPVTDEVRANASLTVEETAQMDVSDDTIITDECLEAAEALVSLRGSAQLTTFKLADESNMGSLKDLYIGTGTQLSVACQPLESRCKRSSQVMTSCVQPIGEGTRAPKATRSCKANRYKDIMNNMYRRAKKSSKKTQTDPIKQPRAASTCQSTITNSDTLDSNISKVTEEELLAELDSKMAEVSPLSIDHFLSVLVRHRKKRKRSKKSASNAKRRKTKLSTAPKPSGDVLAEDFTVGSTPVGTTAQPATSVATASEALTLVQPTSTKLVGSNKRKFPKELVTHNPQSGMVERQTILLSFDKPGA